MATSPIRPADVLAVFERQESPGTPLTAPEVAESVGCARRTAYDKLTALTDRGALTTKKVGARARIWWQPAADRRTTATRDARTDRPEERRDRALRDLHAASRRLMRAETHETVCSVAVEAAHRILGLTLSGLWLHDPESEHLEPVEWTESGAEEYGEPPPFPVEESLVGRVFREGRYRVYDDVTTQRDLYDPETNVRSELVLPLGEHGVLNASSPRVGVFDAVDVSLGRILAANVETALNRADRLERRRDRRRKLTRQRDELERLNQINALVEETIGALVDAATREEIEETVRERLAESEFYVDAWTVTREAASGTDRLRSGEGAATESDPSRVGSGDASGPDPVAAAIDERTPRVVRIPEGGRDACGLRPAADTDDARASLVVPITYGETAFGAVVVSAPEPEAFGDRERTAFETLGRTVGFVINATNNRRLLLGTTAVELEVTLRGTDAWFVSAARRLGDPVTIEGIVPTGDGTVIEYVAIDAGAIDGVLAALEATSAVLDARVLARDDDRSFVECIVPERASDLVAIAEYGATVRTARAADGAGTVTARFPATTSAREAMDVVREAFPTAELLAKRVVDVSDRSATTIRQVIADRLTRRQVTVLRAAFLAGYYESPRETTARELAGSLDVAPSTLYQHMQAAHRNLLGTVFDELSDR